MTGRLTASYIFILTSVILLASCQDDEEVAQQGQSVSIDGYVQKGPFINGTAITASELSGQLVATGKNFNTQIIDNKGAFSLKDIEIQSNFVRLQAQGFYFDEIRGEKSAAQLTLFALADVSNASSVNVNLLSHLEKDRVIYLMQEKEKSFAIAKQQAQQEILAIFGIEKIDMTASELLNISQGGEGNAILLAISAILQDNNTVAELSELLANIITDIREDGKLDSQTNKDRILVQGKTLNLTRIRANLRQRFEELGVAATIPPFEQYIDSDGDGILNKDEDDTPDEFAFTLQKDVAINTITTSNAVRINGLKEGGTANAIIENGGVVINGKVVSDALAQVKNGDELQLSVLTSSVYADTIQATVLIGNTVSSFRAITDDYLPDSFSFHTIEDVAIDSLCISNTITVSGLPYPTPATITNGVLIKNGEAVEGDSTSVVEGDQLAIKLAASPEFGTLVSADLEINEVSSRFEITTDDYTPDDFSFTPVEFAKRDSLYTSETIMLSGLPHPTPISLDQGILLINGSESKISSPTVTTGDIVAIQISSSKDYETETKTIISVGSYQQEFVTKTEADPWQQKARFPGKGEVSDGFVINDKIYFCSDEGEVYEYNPTLDTWSKKNNYPGEPRYGITCFSVRNTGYLGLGKPYSDSYSGNVDSVLWTNREFWAYNYEDDTWKPIAEFPGQGRVSSVNFVINNEVYVGRGGNLFSGEYDVFDFWKYDPTVDQWNQIANFPQQYGSQNKHVFFSINGKGYFGGGTKYGTAESYPDAFYRDFWEYSPTDDFWSKKQDLTFTEPTSASLVCKGIGYAIGAYHYDGDIFDLTGTKIFSYNSKADTWDELELNRNDTNPYSLLDKSFVVNEKIYLLSFDHIWELTLLKK